MTTERERRIRQAIADCDRYISREEKRNTDLRPTKTQELLDWYRGHRAKLVGMLVGG